MSIEQLTTSTLIAVFASLLHYTSHAGARAPPSRRARLRGAHSRPRAAVQGENVERLMAQRDFTEARNMYAARDEFSNLPLGVAAVAARVIALRTTGFQGPDLQSHDGSFLEEGRLMKDAAGQHNEEAALMTAGRLSLTLGYP